VTPRRPKLAIAAAVVVLLLAIDLVRPPADQLSARTLLGAIHLYQRTLSPKMPGWGVRCRFEPTCSHYAEGAIQKNGALVGTARAGWRLLRCGPWTPAGTVDPP
jgi:putative membrane protein insertion efficiency factor